jgi:hypothetical protein
MADAQVKDWFGAKFDELHPLLQQMHLHGGQLAGAVDIVIPNGIAGVLGKRLANKLCVPADGLPHQLRVDISHHPDGLHWDRCFDGTSYMRSVFRPIGTWPGGHWVEDTGPLKMYLTVDVRDGGWNWRCLAMRVLGLRLPLWLFPNSIAFKTVEAGRYRFYVGFSLPLLGTVLSYGGLLSAVASSS